jgi:hypothetical protein
MAALSTDVSDWGFCLETPSLLSKGAPLNGYVLHGEKELEWTGEVAWTKPGNPMASVWHRVGIHFTWVSPGLRALITMRQRGE